MLTIVRTDDTDAFGQPELLSINVAVPEGQSVSKAVISCSSLKFTFLNPVFPVKLHLSGEQTAVLEDNVCGTAELYDAYNKKLTVPCIFEFKTRAGVEE